MGNEWESGRRIDEIDGAARNKNIWSEQWELSW